MRQIRVAFYKAVKNQPVNRTIALWTKLPNWKTPPYSHAELAVGKNEEWTWFSSTNRGDAKGCRWANEKDVIINPDDWDVYELTPKRKPSAIKNICNSIEGLPYDWFGIAGFALPFGQLNPFKKWYCSEACYYAIFGVWKKRISPRGLYKLLKKTHTMKGIKYGSL